MLYISSARDRNPLSILDVVVVIVKCEIIISEVLSWVAGSPFFVHHLDVNKIVRGDFKVIFDGADTRESCGVVLGDHSRSCALILAGLVDDLDRSNICEVGVGVDDFGNPFEPLVGSLVLVAHIEPSRRSKLPSERLFSLLCTRGAVQVEDDVESRIFCPTADTLEIGKTTLGEVFAVGIHDGLVNPISKRDTDGIESKASDLGDIVLGNPAAPMFLEGGVGPSLAEFQYAVKLGTLASATHLVPFIVHHPWFGDELTTEIDTAYFSLSWEPCVDKGREASQS